MSSPGHRSSSQASPVRRASNELQGDDSKGGTIPDGPDSRYRNRGNRLVDSENTTEDRSAWHDPLPGEGHGHDEDASPGQVEPPGCGEDGSEELSKNTQDLSLTGIKELGQEHGDKGPSGCEVEEHSRERDTTREEYLDPTPKTPRISQSPAGNDRNELSRTATGIVTASDIAMPPSAGQSAQEKDFGDKQITPLEDAGDGEGESQSEIQSIMDQFGKDGSGPKQDKVMSPRTDTSRPATQQIIQHPPRKSSLEPFTPASQAPIASPGTIGSAASYASDMAQLQRTQSTESYNRPSSFHSPDSSQPKQLSISDGQVPESPQSSLSLPKALPPEPDPEPDLPFDFHRFLEQLRHRTADPVAKFLRSFLTEFGKKQWMVHEQVKIISDFLAFITNKMAQCEIWRGVSEAEFDNAKEGMEKLVMNRLYTQTFSPAIPSPASAQGPKGKKKDLVKVLGPTRGGQHQEDIERDDVLGQKVRIYGWVQEDHLDIRPVGESGRRFLNLAQQEILKIKTYRAPRDKIICVLNCCKVIFGLLRNSKSSDTSADAFVPLLIYVVLRANPEHLVSNVQYILRFRNQEKLGGEAGYYLSSLMGAIQFIENLDKTSLTISDEEFEKNVEAAVSVIAEKHKEPPPPAQPPRHPHISEKSGLSEPEIVPRNSTEVEYAHPRRPTSFINSKEQHGGVDGSEESSAVNGLLRTIQKPLSSIGRMFSDEASTTQRLNDRGGQGPPMPPEPPRRLSPALFQPPRDDSDYRKPPDDSRQNSTADQAQHRRLSAEDAAARQASAESAEAQRIQRNEHTDVVETLAGMFPDLDRDVIDDVVRVKQGRVGLAVDACLALSS